MHSFRHTPASLWLPSRSFSNSLAPCRSSTHGRSPTATSLSTMSSCRQLAVWCWSTSAPPGIRLKQGLNLPIISSSSWGPCENQSVWARYPNLTSSAGRTGRRNSSSAPATTLQQPSISGHLELSLRASSPNSSPWTDHRNQHYHPRLVRRAPRRQIGTQRRPKRTHTSLIRRARTKAGHYLGCLYQLFHRRNERRSSSANMETLLWPGVSSR